MKKTAKSAAPKLTQDQRYMHAAIRYARRHAGVTGTNPSVACLIVAGEKGNQWIAGRGITAVGGRPHAEPVALEEAGKFAKGATAYVTLEPCAHHGATPPCATTLIEAGVERVVVAQLDPDGRVNSKGLHMLREAGIKVQKNIETEEAAWGLRGYLSRKTKSRPWVILKLAVTADGYLGLRGAANIAISGPVANAQTHLLRARMDAILVGSGTAIIDEPALTCRLSGLENRSPIRIFVENDKPVPTNSKAIKTASRVETFIACPQEKLEERKQQLAGTHCKFIACDTRDGKIALPELLADLADTGISTLMVEGGKKIAESFLENMLVDEILLYVSRDKMADKPKAKTNANWISWPTLPDAIPEGFHIKGHWQYGTDKAIRMVRD
ncbi:MAG: bifunctional diaminohydroxyphosphoribosylaminopyrimidine deaminase/5-amino-6-(5-phosphoribosylamino)uracil reductase RibD [Rhizobiaceae bacterium]|nr:bifunctional diaminohydroxyphosphoribosylaminopyrimidine deaminase/5-amino-6-(5-phosphoribosylamino)uracil reductase RibD [Rhizobiaceae bacterium]